MIIASQRIARWNVTTQKMKVWIHHQRVLTTALQCLATTITTPKTQALCQCGQYMWHATCLTAYRLHECPGVHSCLNHFSFFHASFLLWPFFQRTQKAQATTHFLYDSSTSNVITYNFFCVCVIIHCNPVTIDLQSFCVILCNLFFQINWAI